LIKKQQKKKITLLKKGGKKQENSGEAPKPGLILKTYNSLNHGLKFNQEAELSTNLILKDEIVKEY